MAQQDTRLGWSAKEEWLLSTAGVLAEFKEFGGSDFPGQPLPIITTLNDLQVSGLYVGSEDWGGTYGDYYVGVLNYEGRYSDCVAFGVYTTPGHYDIYWASAVSGAYSVLSHTYQQDGSWSGVWANYWTGATTYDSTTGLYYGKSPWASNLIPRLTPQVPIFNSLQDGLSAIQITTTSVYKLNPGFAVAALASWYGIGGNTIVSPVLISTEREYALFSLDGTTETERQLVSQFLFGGRVFYFSFIPDLAGNPGTHPIEDAILFQFGAAQPKKVFSLIADSSFSNIEVITAPDPYEEQTGSSEEEGGDGDEIVDDDVDFTPLPSSMAVASGFITLFCPSQHELNQLANYMWSPLFDVDTFKKLFANPMDCILGLAVYPFPISASGTKTVSVGGIATTVSMGYTLQQYHIVDCGSVYVPKQWGAYMDYAPYTRFNIFLPYIGFRSISADDIMGKTISLRYMVDILSGACNAELKCRSTVLYSWAGSCAAQIPITGNDWRSAITAGISIAGSVAATVLTQGASAPMIAGTIASATVNSTQLKPEVQRGGSISGSSGFLAGQRPYLVRTNPRSAIPANQNKYSGYPSFVTILLGSLTGYNEVYSVHLENIPATGAELDEIESILKGGAIF